MVYLKISRMTSKVTAKQLDMYTIEAQEERQMKEVPLKVLFNPVITPVDNAQVGLPTCLIFYPVCVPCMTLYSFRLLCAKVVAVCTGLVALCPEQCLSMSKG